MKVHTENQKKAIEILEELSLREHLAGLQIKRLVGKMLDEGEDLSADEVAEIYNLSLACYARSIRAYEQAEKIDKKYFAGDILLLGQMEKNAV